MGSLIGQLVTKKKRKKLQKQITAEGQLQTASALHISEIEREAQRIQQVRANVDMLEARKASIREANIRRAQIIASSVNAGAGKSTSAQSAAGGLVTQFNSWQGLTNVMAGFSERLSKQQEAASLEQSNIISSQGRQQVLGAKLETQNQKSQLIGSAIDTGISVIGAFVPEGALLSGAKSAFSGLSSAFSSGSNVISASTFTNPGTIFSSPLYK